MKVTGFIIDDFIWDEFDLPLNEDVDPAEYLSIDEVRAEVVKRINELNKLGYSVHPEQIVYYELRDHKRTTAGLQPVADHEYLFVMSKYAARRKNEQYFDMIIYHELCHLLQIEYLFNGDFIGYVNNKLLPDPDKAEYVHSVLRVAGGHTPLWKMFVNKLNRILAIEPPIAATLESSVETDIFSESLVQPEYKDFEFDGFFDYFPEVMTED